MTEDDLFTLVLGRMVRRLRGKLGITQEDLCIASKLSQSVLSRIEHGTTCPTIVEARRLAKALGTFNLLDRVEVHWELREDIRQLATERETWKDDYDRAVHLIDLSLISSEPLGGGRIRPPKPRVRRDGK